MAKNKTIITKAPTGLSLVRSEDVFTLGWKIGDSDYKDGQYFSYLLNTAEKENWTAAESIDVTATSQSISLNKLNFYPYAGKPHLHQVGMRVKGDRATYKKKKKNYKPVCSDWSEKRFDLSVPKIPSVTATLDQELTNVCVFSWSVTHEAEDAAVFTDVQWQTILVRNSKETDGKNLSWQNAEEGASSAESSRTITEDTAILYKNGNSYARWFRVRSRGPKGDSDWAYAYHVYALPRQADVTDTYAKETEEGGFQCVVDWTAGSNRQNPNDRTIVQYALVVPSADLTCPSGASWVDANVSSDTAEGDAAVFGIDDQLSKDQCLFIRVNTHHDSNVTYGRPQLSKTGFLKDPSGLSVQTNNTTHRATITATNNSDVEDSVLVVRYVPATGDSLDVGIIPHGSTSVTVQCPNWDGQTATSFEVYAMVGTATKQTRSDNVDSYAVTPRMKSKTTLTKGGAVPVAPQNVAVKKAEGLTGTVQVIWDWPWTEANSAELSWADHPDAWESTKEPESYVVSNLHASKWNISNLEMGKTWYVRVRLLVESQEGTTYGPWSDIEQGTIDLSTSPNKPLLDLSSAIIPVNGEITASWVYTTTDKTLQAYAEVAVVNNGVYTPIAHTLTAQHLTINAISAGFSAGNVYNLAVRVKSASGRNSEWSDVVSVTVAQPLVCSISQSSLVQQTESHTATDVTTGQTVTFTRSFKALTEMPMTLTVTGAGSGGITSVVIERAASYHLERPDENDFNGYQGEAVAIRTQLGQAQMTFDVDDLIGSLDDGAQYKIVATVKDGLGQVATVEQEFEVRWAHQALVPSAEIVIDQEELIAKITPIAPQGAIASDVADIYRLSIDKPELIVSGATFGQTYVDPYPALGEMGGHRIVLRTKNNDYITPDNTLAQIDSPELDVDFIQNEEQWGIIDFKGQQIKFYYDIDYSSTWAKDFQETQYLGGSIQGDWNSAVSRTGTLSTKAITVLDQDMLQAVRRLAEHAGICHVRTADGSSYAADVQVSEDRVHDEQEMVVNYSLSITRVDSQGYDGMTLAQYEEEMQDSEEVS